MKYTLRLQLVLGTLALGIVSNVASSQSAAAKCTSEECACEEALRQNTLEALEDYLRKYPHSVDNKASACSALATPPIDEAPNSESQPIGRGGAVETDLSPI